MAPRNFKNKPKSPKGGGDHRPGNSKNKFKPDKNSFKTKQAEKRNQQQSPGKSPQNGAAKSNGKFAHQNGKSQNFGKQNGKAANPGFSNINRNGKSKVVKNQHSEKLVPKKQKRAVSESEDEEEEQQIVQKQPTKQKIAKKDVKKGRVEDFKPKVEAVKTKNVGKKGTKAKPVVSESDEEDEDEITDSDEDVPPPTSVNKLKNKFNAKTAVQPKPVAKVNSKKAAKEPVKIDIDSVDDEVTDEEEEFEDALDGLSDIEDEEQDESDEEEDVPPVKNGKQKEVKKSESSKKVEKVVETKKEATKAEKKTKTSEAESNRKAEKRSATDALFVMAKKNRLLSQVDKNLIAENNRRRLERDNRAIYISLPGKMDKVSDSMLKALHPDILVVSRLKKAAFLMFLSEAVREKAFKALQKAQLKGKPVKVDYCGTKGSRPFSTPDPETTQVNMTQLVVSDLPTGTAKNSLEIIFPKAAEIVIMIRKQVAFLTFANEADAREAWDKGKNLKVSSVPVMVRYRTFNKLVQSEEPPTKKMVNLETIKSAGESKAKDSKKTSDVVKAQSTSDDDEQISDEEEGIESDEFEDEEEEESDDE